MSEADIKRLFEDIADVYPSFERNIGELKIVQVWHKRLKGMSSDTAARILEDHIGSDGGDRAPTLSTFVRQLERKTEAYVDDRQGRYKLEAGVLYWCVDGEEYEVGNPDEEPYYVNSYGRICRMQNGQEITI